MGAKTPQEFFSHHGDVRFVRLQCNDYSGVFHCRLVSRVKCLMIEGDSGHPYKVPVNSMIIPLSTSPGCDASPPQVWELHPDWETLRVCYFAKRHATVLCDLTRSGTENPFAMCPRQLLKRTIADFEREDRASLLVGFEIEFILLDHNLQVPASLDKVEGFSMASGIRGSNLAIVEEIFDTLEQADIPVHHMHTEAKDQLEFSLEPQPPLEAVDDLMYAQEAIRTIAIRHNRRATMTPKPFLQRFPTNGLHMHISVSPPNLADGFLAGILTKLRPLCAFGLLSWDSYHRVEDDGTGVWVGWGTENRDLPVRAVGPAHWEIRPADATANILSLPRGRCRRGVCRSAGGGGLPLTWKDCRIFPENLSGEEKATYGISESLPRTLKDAIECVKADADLPAWVGRELLDKYPKAKDKEAELFAKMTDEERHLNLLGFF